MLVELVTEVWVTDVVVVVWVKEIDVVWLVVVTLVVKVRVVVVVEDCTEQGKIHAKRHPTAPDGKERGFASSPSNHTRYLHERSAAQNPQTEPHNADLSCGFQVLLSPVRKDSCKP